MSTSTFGPVAPFVRARTSTDAAVHIVVRFTLIDRNTMHYQATIDPGI